MPIPTPRKKESKEEYINRFMENSIMLKEYPDKMQRYAIALGEWNKRNK